MLHYLHCAFTLQHGCTRIVAPQCGDAENSLQVLLAKYSGEKDVVLGTPVANRDMSEIQDLLGCFIKCATIKHSHYASWAVASS